ncbi:grasp-with-spasm system A modified peptide [Chryseobacterium indologenes]|uniref:TIGR04139 family peptide modification target n=1 Tax=Chryseobacterium indologenes TaxID=253 RepID=A0A0N0ZVN4_CHRID|nr:grasp-with-spasm system A modified peptide [Chryseobacterium indologenes]KPE50185.1 hypothetical protein AOB46_15650 [Chryseobacterium indologenes]
MKKLQGMKSSFSSLENKKLRNLQVITGGTASSRNAPSEYPTPQGVVQDTDYYTDNDSPGKWKYKSRLIIGEIERVD